MLFVCLASKPIPNGFNHLIVFKGVPVISPFRKAGWVSPYGFKCISYGKKPHNANRICPEFPGMLSFQQRKAPWYQSLPKIKQKSNTFTALEELKEQETKPSSWDKSAACGIGGVSHTFLTVSQESVSQGNCCQSSSGRAGGSPGLGHITEVERCLQEAFQTSSGTATCAKQRSDLLPLCAGVRICVCRAVWLTQVKVMVGAF